MRIARTTKQFRRNYAKLARSGKDMKKLDALMRLLMQGKPIPSKHRDHGLQGEWKRIRDSHIEGDWLLLYELVSMSDGQEAVVFHATDTHENLFG